MKYAVPAFFALLFLSACIGSQRPAPVTTYGVSAGVGSAGVHNVVSGETLWSISQRYNIPMRDIAHVNNLRAPFMLDDAQRLILPPPREYRVRAGDTLYTVSRLFGVSTSELASLNDLRAPYAIQTGQTLRLPSVTEGVKVASRSRATPSAKPVQQENIYVQPRQKPQADDMQPVEKKRPEPQAKVTAETPGRTPQGKSSGKFLTPVDGPVISSYGPKKSGLHNDGINIKSAKGTPVRAAENGVIVYAGNELKGSGNLVLIRHEDRWMSAYAHMDRILIRRGNTVKRGQTIGTVGQTGSVDTPQLHFELRRGTEAINPQLYLDGTS